MSVTEMFRISQYMQEIVRPSALMPARTPTGPVVIWNLIRRCNLACKHCYSISADYDFPGELSTTEILQVMEDLRSYVGVVTSHASIVIRFPRITIFRVNCQLLKSFKSWKISGHMVSRC